MDWIIKCPRCQERVRIRSEDLLLGPDCWPEWEEIWWCDNCGRKFLINIEASIEITPIIKEI